MSGRPGALPPLPPQGSAAASSLEKRLLERVLVLEAGLRAQDVGCDALGLGPLEDVVRSSGGAAAWSHLEERRAVCDAAAGEGDLAELGAKVSRANSAPRPPPKRNERTSAKYGRAGSPGPPRSNRPKPPLGKFATSPRLGQARQEPPPKRGAATQRYGPANGYKKPGTRFGGPGGRAGSPPRATRAGSPPKSRERPGRSRSPKVPRRGSPESVDEVPEELAEDPPKPALAPAEEVLEEEEEEPNDDADVAARAADGALALLHAEAYDAAAARATSTAADAVEGAAMALALAAAARNAAVAGLKVFADGEQLAEQRRAEQERDELARKAKLRQSQVAREEARKLRAAMDADARLAMSVANKAALAMARRNAATRWDAACDATDRCAAGCHAHAGTHRSAVDRNRERLLAVVSADAAAERSYLATLSSANECAAASRVAVQTYLRDIAGERRRAVDDAVAAANESAATAFAATTEATTKTYFVRKRFFDDVVLDAEQAAYEAWDASRNAAARAWDARGRAEGKQAAARRAEILRAKEIAHQHEDAATHAVEFAAMALGAAAAAAAGARDGAWLAATAAVCEDFAELVVVEECEVLGYQEGNSGTAERSASLALVHEVVDEFVGSATRREAAVDGVARDQGLSLVTNVVKQLGMEVIEEEMDAWLAELVVMKQDAELVAARARCLEDDRAAANAAANAAALEARLAAKEAEYLAIVEAAHRDAVAIGRDIYDRNNRHASVVGWSSAIRASLHADDEAHDLHDFLHSHEAAYRSKAQRHYDALDDTLKRARRRFPPALVAELEAMTADYEAARAELAGVAGDRDALAARIEDLDGCWAATAARLAAAAGDLRSCRGDVARERAERAAAERATGGAAQRAAAAEEEVREALELADLAQARCEEATKALNLTKKYRERDIKEFRSAYAAGSNYASGLDAANAAMAAARRRIDYLAMFAPPDDESYSRSYALFQTYESPRAPPRLRPARMPGLPGSRSPHRRVKPGAKVRSLLRKDQRSRSPPPRLRPRPPAVRVGRASEHWPHAGERLDAKSAPPGLASQLARAQRAAQQRALPPVDYRNGRKLLGPAARPAADRAKEIQRRAIRH